MSNSDRDKAAEEALRKQGDAMMERGEVDNYAIIDTPEGKRLQIKRGDLPGSWRPDPTE